MVSNLGEHLVHVRVTVLLEQWRPVSESSTSFAIMIGCDFCGLSPPLPQATYLCQIYVHFDDDSMNHVLLLYLLKQWSLLFLFTYNA